jgi:hypothetical protein
MSPAEQQLVADIAQLRKQEADGRAVVCLPIAGVIADKVGHLIALIADSQPAAGETQPEATRSHKKP